MGAAAHGHVNCLCLLIENGANPNYINPIHGSFPLSNAAAFRCVNCVRVLLEKRADVNLIDINKAFIPLISAITFRFSLKCYGDGRRVEVVKELLERGADPNIANSNGTTPLMHAYFHGHVECLRLSLNKVGDPNRVNANGQTPMQFAAAKNNIECPPHVFGQGWRSQSLGRHWKKFDHLGGEQQRSQLYLSSG